MNVRRLFLISSITVTLIILAVAVFRPNAAWLLAFVLPLIGLGLRDMFQRRRTLLRIYPVVGHLRYLFESIRPEIQQYFVESDTDGQPVSREFRALVYQRAKGELDTRPFGTLFEVFRNGYEWVNHSLAPSHRLDANPRIRFGGSDCSRPYDASPFNISAMSFGALSQNAIMVLNKGAKAAALTSIPAKGASVPTT